MSERGITVADLDGITLGMALDYLTACQNEDVETEARRKRGGARMATQADIDAF